MTAKTGAFLGNYAESSSTHENQGFKSFLLKFSKWDFDAQLAEKYALQMQARKSMLEHHYSLSELDRPKKAHRVCNCRRDFRPVFTEEKNGKKTYEMSKPSIFQHKETNNIFYGGLMVCGSGYACPVDAPKIAEERSIEIRKAVTEHVKNGGICLFITLTFPHYFCDTIKASIDALRASFRRFRSGRAFVKLTVKLGYIGLIRGIETTWGESNGWHPHSHEIWFVDPDFIKEIKALNNSLIDCELDFSVATLTALCERYLKPDLFKLWESAVVRSGLSAPSYERGMVIKACETEEQLLKRLSEYLVKTGLEKPPWGVDDEITKLHSKRGKPGRFTPFDFLRMQYDVEPTKGEKYRYRCLFAEFVTAFKGVAKVYWSPGLKKKFQITDLTDEQIADQQTESADLLYQIPPPIWVFVIGINDHRAQLLIIFKNEGVEAGKAWLSDLLTSYANYFDEKYELLSPNLRQILEYYGVGLNEL